MLTISQLKSKNPYSVLKKTHYLNNSKARITNEILYAIEEQLMKVLQNVEIDQNDVQHSVVIMFNLKEFNYV